MKTVTNKNLLSLLTQYFIDNGCDAEDTRLFFTANRFGQGLVIPLAPVCLVPGNKPANSRSKQTHIHITSKSREFFYTSEDLDAATVSTPWVIQNLMIARNNIQALNGEPVSHEFSVDASFMMMKIECRKSQEKQVQLSKLTQDDNLFLELRRALYEKDILIFLKYRNSSRLFVAGIPLSYYSSRFSFESARKTNRFKSETFEALESKNAITVKSAIEKILTEHESDDVIESEEPISDALYQSMVNSAKASETVYHPEEYVEHNPGSNLIRHRPPTNPALGKEAIADNCYHCSVDSNHETFIKSDGTQYMEVHHLIPLNQQKHFKYKLDTKANILPLCPNCHRMLHYGRFEDIEAILKELFEKNFEALKQSGLNISYEDLKEYYM